jgi:methionyl aminopeptidase
MRWRDRGIELKSPEQVELMRRAGLVVARTLEMLVELARPGLTTGDLDVAAEKHVRDLGGIPSFLGYQGFTGSLCVSVNEEVVHGVPGARLLREGDVVSIDCGADVDGWHGDAAVTVALGDVPPEVQALMRDTDDALWRGLAAARVGGRLGDVSHAVESHLTSRGDYGILDDYTGHGIGTAMHQPPDVPNRGRPGRGPRLVAGMAIAVEPMVTLGGAETDVLADEWTVVTRDGSWAAHYEHTVALTDDGPWVLTALDGGRARLTELGAPCGGG